MTHHITRHARHRASTRGICAAAIQYAIEFGQARCQRGADVFTIGWRDVRRCAAEFGVDLARWLGIEVVCARNGAVLTVYRNRNPHALRKRRELQS